METKGKRRQTNAVNMVHDWVHDGHHEYIYFNPTEDIKSHAEILVVMVISVCL